MVIYIVSGLPRSGTSMMKILANSGLKIAKDDLRKADDNNEEGYFEINDIINKLEKNPELVKEYDNLILKVTAYGIKFLPKADYKIIYMERDINEVVDSMEKMIGKDDKNKERTKELFSKLNESTKSLIKEIYDMSVLIVNYNDLIETSDIKEIMKFLNIDSSKEQDMKKAINKQLYRNRN